MTEVITKIKTPLQTLNPCKSEVKICSRFLDISFGSITVNPKNCIIIVWWHSAVTITHKIRSVLWRLKRYLILIS